MIAHTAKVEGNQMLTRLEIDGFKTFSRFAVDLEPFTAIVGPNASGKSNLFDAIKLLSLLSSTDVRTAMMALRGEPNELFRRTPNNQSKKMTLAAEVLLPPRGVDQFGAHLDIRAQRLRYEVSLEANLDSRNNITGVFVSYEFCGRVKKTADRSRFVKGLNNIEYGGNINPFLTTDREGGRLAFRIRQDGPNKRGKPSLLPATEASRTALSTVSTAEFPHLCMLRNFLSSPSFLEINPSEARKETDRFQTKSLLPSAANLASVLARIKDETSTSDEPEGALSDVSADLSRMIPSTRRVVSLTSSDQKGYSYAIEMAEGLTFSARVISDGTLRLLVLIAALNDPDRRGLLCFEEPENGIHEGRVGSLVEIMREATADVGNDYFQILLNTHSPAVMRALKDNEIVAADMVTSHSSGHMERHTRMRAAQPMGDLLDPGAHLTSFELGKLLHKLGDAA
jgi:predicted ATPase